MLQRTADVSFDCTSARSVTRDPMPIGATTDGSPVAQRSIPLCRNSDADASTTEINARPRADPLAATLAIAVARRAASAAPPLRVPTLHRQFEPYRTYRLRSSASVNAALVPAPWEATSGTPFPIVLTADQTAYFIAGFTEGDTGVILYDQRQGYWLALSSDAHPHFEPVDLGFSIPDDVANSWHKQTGASNCWFAALAALAGKKQATIESKLRTAWGWTDQSFYGIGSRSDLEQIGQMVGVRIGIVGHSVEEIRRALCTSHAPLVIGVPGHAMVLYAMQEDGTASIWDPANGKIQYPRWEILKEALQFVAGSQSQSSIRFDYTNVRFDYSTMVPANGEPGTHVYESELDYS